MRAYSMFIAYIFFYIEDLRIGNLHILHYPKVLGQSVHSGVACIPAKI